MSTLKYCAILFVLAFAIIGCKSEEDNTPPDVGDPGKADTKQVVSLANGVFTWTGHGPLFNIDSSNNVYVFSGGSGSSIPSTGFFKIDPNGVSTYHLSGWLVNFLARDENDNLYLFVFVPNSGGGIASPEIIVFTADGSILSYCTGCIPASWPGVIASSGNILLVGTNSKSINVMTNSGSGGTLVGANVNSATCEDGIGVSARFKGIAGMATDSLDNIFVLDSHEQAGTLSCTSRIRKISPAGVVTTIYTLPADESKVGMGLAIDKDGNLYYAARSAIIKVTQAGVSSRYCGGANSSSLMQDGNCSSVFIWNPSILGFNSAGDLIFYEVDTSVQPQLYRLFSIVDSK